MKIEDQVCTLEQSKKLFQLGIGGSCFFWHLGAITKTWIIIDPDHSEIDMGKDMPAFTVAELGVMLPAESGMKFFSSHYNDHLGVWICEFSGFKTEEDHEAWDWGANPPPKIHETEEETEAQARAEMLIYLLENNLTTPEEVNNRLSN